MDRVEIRDLLIIITTMVTILGVIIKTVNNLFMESIINSFRLIPAKQSVFDTVSKSIVYSTFFMEVIITIAMLIKYMKYGPENKENNNIIPTDYIQISAFIILVILIILVVLTINTFCEIKNKIIGMIQISKNIEKVVKKYRFKNDSTNRLNKIEIIINKIISLFFIGASIFSLFAFVVSEGEQEDIHSIMTILVFWLVGLSMFTIANSLSAAIDMLENKNLYYLITKSKVIMCNYFFEYHEYYLIIEKGTERYIKKSDVEEIKKEKII